MIRTARFRAAWWLPGPHLQTLWPNVFRPCPRVQLSRERLELADGDFLDLDWNAIPPGNSLTLILHGLEGSSDSCYARGLMRALARRGMAAVLMHFRGCSGMPNRLPRRYHAGETGDLAHVVDVLGQRFPGVALFCVGYSLGGNVLLKWLGETGAAAPLRAAVAVSVPFELATCADRLQHGFSRIYQFALLRRLKQAARDKADLIHDLVSLPRVLGSRDMRQFDEVCTAPLHGFANAGSYYAQSSSRQYIKHIRIPTLILQARDDPFMWPDAIPSAAELSEQVVLELSEMGGHVGFVTGPPWKPVYWLEHRIPEFLANPESDMK